MSDGGTFELTAAGAIVGLGGVPKPGGVQAQLRRRLRRMGVMEMDEAHSKQGARLRARVRVGKSTRELVTSTYPSAEEALGELCEAARTSGSIRPRTRRARGRPVARPHVPVEIDDPRTLAQRADDAEAEREGGPAGRRGVTPDA